MPTKTNNRILVIGDLHFKQSLGYADYLKYGREKEQKEILDFIIDTSINCQKIIFLGDIFNGRNNPSTVIKEATNFIERFEYKELFLISGNHDLSADGQTAIDYLKEIKNKNWHIITDKIEQIGNFTFCPYFTKAQLEVKNDEDGQKKIMEQLSGGDILFVHFAISDSLANGGMSTNLFKEIVLPKSELEKKYKLVISGHIHNPCANGKTIIAGSIFNNEISETQKYIWKIDENTLAVEQIKLPGRPIIKLENPSVEDFNKLDKSSIIKVVFTDKKLKNNIDEIKKEIKKFDAGLILEQYPQERKKLHFENGMLEFSVEQLLEVYGKQKKIDITKLKSAYELIK